MAVVLALLHDLKAEAWPTSLAAPGWRAEARLHRSEARRRFTPSMAQRIDVTKLYRQAVRAIPEAIEGLPPLPVPDVCVVTPTELLAEAEDQRFGKAS